MGRTGRGGGNRGGNQLLSGIGDFAAQPRNPLPKRGAAGTKQEDDLNAGGAGPASGYPAKKAQSSMPRTGSWWNGLGKRERVILTRSRGDAEEEAEKRRSERADERGDSGGWWPAVRSGRAFRRENKAGATGLFGSAPGDS